VSSGRGPLGQGTGLAQQAPREDDVVVPLLLSAWMKASLERASCTRAALSGLCASARASSTWTSAMPARTSVARACTSPIIVCFIEPPAAVRPEIGLPSSWQDARTLRTPSVFSKVGVATENTCAAVSQRCVDLDVARERLPVRAMWQSMHSTPASSLRLPAYISALGVIARSSDRWHSTHSVRRLNQANKQQDAARHGARVNAALHF
jgi:hypothetical protein